MNLSSLIVFFDGIARRLPSTYQNSHQRFNMLFVFVSQLCIEVWIFQYNYHSIFYSPIFFSLRVVLWIGWHYLFVYASRCIPLFTRLVTWVESIAWSILFWVEFFLLHVYQTNLTDRLCNVVVATSWRESSEFLSGLTIESVLKILGVWGLMVLISLGLNRIDFRRYIGVWGKWLVLFSIFGTLYLTGIRAFNCYGKVFPIPTGASCAMDRIVWNPQVAIVRVHRVGKQVSQMRSPQLLKGFKVQSVFHEPVDIVVILGETARADFFQTYGFSRSTTPRLDSLVKTGDAFCFNDARSAANTTVSSSKRIFTFWNDMPGKEWYEFPDLISCFAQAGYATRWYTNQETEGENSVEFIFGTGAQQLKTPYGKSAGVFSKISFDGLLLPIVQHYAQLSIVERKSAPAGLFSVIHLMGSHQAYYERYPRKFARFTAQDVPVSRGTQADEATAQYMNTLLYTDHVLGSLFAHYRERPALIIYFSDHGESVYDNALQPNLCGHGGRACMEQADVPFVVMLTPAFRSAYPELTRRMYESRFRPISTAWFTNTLTLTVGIETPYSDERYNFFGSQFSPQTERKTEGEDGRFTFPPVKVRRVQ